MFSNAANFREANEVKPFLISGFSANISSLHFLKQTKLWSYIRVQIPMQILGSNLYHEQPSLTSQACGEDHIRKQHKALDKCSNTEALNKCSSLSPYTHSCLSDASLVGVCIFRKPLVTGTFAGTRYAPLLVFAMGISLPIPHIKKEN